eukprot:g1899.t1
MSLEYFFNKQKRNAVKDSETKAKKVMLKSLLEAKSKANGNANASET